MFSKVLIANRGEIAIRIIKTLKKMKITSVAIYSEADRNSPHVRLADESYYVGHSPSTESYLSIPNIIEAIKISGAEAVHPGYGFLSENPEFAKKLEEEGITLIGPDQSAIRSMGDKIQAKKIALKASISTVPGYIGIIKNIDEAIKIAKKIGFPVIVKAAAGGGGRGMRVVKNAEQMNIAYESAKYEAANAFNDERLFIEKFIEKPRHIEIQVLADKHRNIVCLGDRDCSIQRYHQKIIEEAPSTFISEKIRQKMYKQAKLLCKQVSYHSAGTVEFIVDQKKNFYFLEMNTRLQVEHTVTEMITGIDIVEEMVKIAYGMKLSFSQKDVKLNGFAIESRIYAEDPLRGFLPSTGRISEYKEPPKNSNIRIDTGVAPGSEISMFYDSMIAKLCSYDAHSREGAINKMKMALGQFLIRGISCNISFLEAIFDHERFLKNDITTNFIDEEYPDGFSGADLKPEIREAFIACGIHIFVQEHKRDCSIQNQVTDQTLNIGTRWIVIIEDKIFPVIIKEVSGGYNIRQGLSRIYTRGKWPFHSKLYTANVNGRKTNVQIQKIKDGYLLTNSGVTSKVYIRSLKVSELESIMQKKKTDEFQEEVIAPISGTIIKINVKVGDIVKKGQELFVISAMKMENVILAEQECRIKKILLEEGSVIASGQVIVELQEK